MRRAVLAARLVLGGVFLYAGLVKMSASHAFALTIAPFAHLPGDWLRPVSYVLTATEILAGVLLFTPRVFPIGAAAALALSALYAGVVSWALANNIIVDCGCFGQDGTPSAAKMEFAVTRDIFLAALAVTVLLYRERRRRAD
jgi:putative oxidoreductase